MDFEGLTERDCHYLRAVFYLAAGGRPVTPTEASGLLGVTKVSAYQKLRRLEALGLGSYFPREGFRLNDAGIAAMEGEIRKHHLIERFLELRLGMDERRSCGESERLAASVSADLLDRISIDVGGDARCDCGCCIHPPFDGDSLRKCHWFTSLFACRTRPEGAD